MTRENARQVILTGPVISTGARARENAPAARKVIPATAVPPYRYARPGMTPELAAMLAARDLEMPFLDELVLRWRLQRFLTGPAVSGKPE